MEGFEIMADGVQDVSKTGKVRRSELIEPRILRDGIQPKAKSDQYEASASSTGIMPVYHEPADDSAERDADKPAEAATG